MAVIGTAAVPSVPHARGVRSCFALSRNKRLVVIFQRGAADGLNIVIPHAEPAYYQMRPSIAIQRRQVVDLNGFFGLHPSLACFKPLWDQGHLAIVHAAGSPDTTRSHFDAQDYMESGTPGVKSTTDGWLNRVLQSEQPTKESPFSAVALGPSLPRILSGKAQAVARQQRQLPSASRAAIRRQRPLGNTFEAMYDQSVDTVLHGTGQETFEAVKMLKAADPKQYTPAAGANYPQWPLR